MHRVQPLLAVVALDVSRAMGTRLTTASFLAHSDQRFLTRTALPRALHPRRSDTDGEERRKICRKFLQQVLYACKGMA